jgi:hypothetical protein
VKGAAVEGLRIPGLVTTFKAKKSIQKGPRGESVRVTSQLPDLPQGPELEKFGKALDSLWQKTGNDVAICQAFLDGAIKMKEVSSVVFPPGEGPQTSKWFASGIGRFEAAMAKMEDPNERAHMAGLIDCIDTIVASDSLGSGVLERTLSRKISETLASQPKEPEKPKRGHRLHLERDERGLVIRAVKIDSETDEPIEEMIISRDEDGLLVGTETRPLSPEDVVDDDIVSDSIQPDDDSSNVNVDDDTTDYQEDE